MAKESKEQILKEGPKNFQCPKCGAINAIDARFCDHCGAFLIPGENESENKGKGKSFLARHKKAIIITTVTGLVILGMAGFFWYSSARRAKEANEAYKTNVKRIWLEIGEKAALLKTMLADVKSVDDFDDVSNTIPPLVKLLNEKSFEMERWNVPAVYSDSYKNLVDSLKKTKDYLEKLNEIITDPLEARGGDLDDLRTKASEAQDKTADFIEASKTFIEKNVLEGIFDVSKVLKAIEEFQNNEKLKAEEAKRKAEQTAAEEVVSSFMTNLPNAYSVSGGDTWAEAQRIASSYWSASGMITFRNDYMVYFASEVAYKGGKVLSSERIGEGKYTVYAEERAEVPLDLELGTTTIQTTLTYFIVEKSGTKWLISGHGLK